MEGIKKKEEKKDKEEIEEKEEIKDTTSLECSSKDYVSEDFDWVDKDIYSKESKLEYLKFPLKEWKDIIYQIEYRITLYYMKKMILNIQLPHMKNNIKI